MKEETGSKRGKMSDEDNYSYGQGEKYLGDDGGSVYDVDQVDLDGPDDLAFTQRSVCFSLLFFSSLLFSSLFSPLLFSLLSSLLFFLFLVFRERCKS